MRPPSRSETRQAIDALQHVRYQGLVFCPPFPLLVSHEFHCLGQSLVALGEPVQALSRRGADAGAVCQDWLRHVGGPARALGHGLIGRTARTQPVSDRERAPLPCLSERVASQNPARRKMYARRASSSSAAGR